MRVAPDGALHERAGDNPLIPAFSPPGAVKSRHKARRALCGVLIPNTGHLNPMPLPNRVTPSGEIIATPHRGLFTGNRGIIHDPLTKTLTRRWASRAWLICLCDFRGRRREVMAGRSWTELFFLDEATALAAGHRPCFFCRRQDALRFRAAWEAGNGAANARASEVDAVLHRERLNGRAKRLHPLPMAWPDLPDGAMILAGRESFLVLGGSARPWSPAGYGTARQLPQDIVLLTPPSTLRALAAGYRPVLHPSAGGPAGAQLRSIPRGYAGATRGVLRPRRQQT